MTFGDYPMDKLLFVLTAAWIGVSIPTKHFWTGSAKNAANFMYGAPGCVDELAASVKIDMIDDHKPLDVGFSSAGFSNEDFIQGFKSEFASDGCKDETTSTSCEVDFFLGTGQVGTRSHPWTTTHRPNVQTSTSSTTANPDDDAKIPYKLLDHVINLDKDRVVSPFLNAEKDNTDCHEILSRVRGEGESYDPFEDSQLAKVLFCSAVYGWPLGEYCDTAIDNPDLFYGDTHVPTTTTTTTATTTAITTTGVIQVGSTSGSIAATGAAVTIQSIINAFTTEEKNEMRKVCRNATRAQCADKHITTHTVQPNTNWESTGVFGPNEGLDLPGIKAGLKENPCIMSTGFGIHPENSFKDSTVGSIPFRGSRTEPRATTDYFNSRNGQINGALPTADTPHVQENNDGSIYTSKDFKADGKIGRFNTQNGAFGLDSIEIPRTTEFARVHVPLGETDLRYVAERMISDALTLAQGAEVLGRENDLWRKIDQRCFSDGVNGSTDVLIIFSATCIIFVFLGTFLRGFIGQQGCFNVDSNFAKSALNFNNYVLAIIGGIAGFLASWDLGGFSAQSGDFHTDRVPRLQQHDTPDGVAELAAAIDEGQFHSFVELRPSEAALIHALTAFSLLIIVAGAFVTVIETKVSTKGGVGWVKLDESNA